MNPLSRIGAAVRVLAIGVALAGYPAVATAQHGGHGGGHASGGSARGGSSQPRGGTSGSGSNEGSGGSTHGPSHPGGGQQTTAPRDGSRSTQGDDHSSSAARPESSAPRSNAGNANGSEVARTVPRQGPRNVEHGVVVVPRAYYPAIYGFGWGGLGFGYYDVDPFYSAAFSGGYAFFEEGSLRLKVSPRNGQVFVDGYYAGVVDDFDGVFQKLRLEAGPHHVEIRADGFETLEFDVRILPDQKTTYTGRLRPDPGQ